MEKETKETVDTLKQEIEQLKAENSMLKMQVEQVTDLELSLEVANERWVKQVNDNTALEVRLRKLNRG